MQVNQVMPTDPQQLRAEASMRDFKLKQLVRLAQLWPDVTIQQLESAKHIADAEQRVRDAKNDLDRIKREVFAASRWA